jgi:ABC-type oligopeptide transport system substrate-binding subunit
MVFSFRRVASPVLQAAISAENDDTEAPHLWFASWQPDYADAFNGFDDRLSCNSIHNYGKRTCNETDDLILQAAQETDPTPRIQLYRQIEETFFGPHGEHPIIPIFTPITYKAIQPRYDYTPIPFHGDQWYNDTIDMNAKQAAQD